MAHDYIQIPPDSTGKKIRHTGRLDFELINLVISDFTAFERGDTVLGISSGATSKFIGFTVELGENYLHTKESTGIFTVGEQLSIAGTIVGEIDNYIEQHTPNVILSDPDNPFNRGKIDNKGSQYVRYSEGDLGFDAFGHAQFSQVTQMQAHTFLYHDEPYKYWDQTANGGTLTHVPQQSCMLFSVNDQSGSKVSRTTNQYYPYNPGDGNELLMSLRIGDLSKDGLVRRWGLFDDGDGIFFEISGSVRSVVQRSSASGTVVDEKVTSDDVNGDPLDNINISEYIADPTKYNLYWIDYQWLGVGKVRMGTFSPSGKRVTVHTFKNPNNKTLPWAKRGTLPIRIEQFNETGTSGTSEMRMVCATMARQSDEIVYDGEIYTQRSNRTAISGSDFTPLVTARPELLHGGLTNRLTIIPTDVEVIVEGDPIELRVLVDANLTGSSFGSPHPYSSVTVDTSSTSLTGGTRFESLMFGSGVTHRELDENLDNALQLGADGVTQPLFTFSAQTVNPSGNANVTMLVRWKEVR